jgi:bifunctional non-homologous end joining protein LigD
MLNRAGAVEYALWHPERSQRHPIGPADGIDSVRKPPKGAKKAGFPGFILPMLATSRSGPHAAGNWLHEIKFDGYRLQAHIRSDRVKLLTRTGLDWSARFGVPLAVALADLPVEEAIIDGEVVAEGKDGAPDFSALQDALSTGRTDRLIFYAFDLLYLDGYDLRPVPLIGRKTALATLIAPSGMVRYSEHFEGDGKQVFRHVCRLGLEGVVSKLDAPYRSGRSKGWIKSKCFNRQEFVVAGYVPSTVSNTSIGSLVLGYFDNGKLIHAGRVGTGFSHKVADELFRRLDAMSKSPFAKKLSTPDARRVCFVQPELVAEVEFRTWTADGLIRHSTFRGLREDKLANEVALEVAPEMRPVR